MDSTQTFKQSQFSYWILIPLLLLPILVLSSIDEKGIPVALIFGLAGPALLVLLFYRMTVSVSDESLVVRFGVGLIKKRIQLKDVKECRPVKSSFWMGWGIRMIENGWLYNCHGFDALELTFKNSKRVIWVGSPDVSALRQAVDARIGK